MWDELPQRLSGHAVFGTTLTTVPAEIPYLQADPQRAAAWRERLRGEGMLIGLVWAGAPRMGMAVAQAMDRRRSLPLAALAPLAELRGVRFVSLQVGPAAAQPPPPGLAMLDPMPHCADFDDTAAVVAALDLVIAVDTAVAHLAGALGRPVWLLNRFDTCWRWLWERPNSPWYPTMRIYRQQTPGEWAGVVEQVAADLAEAARSR